MVTDPAGSAGRTITDLATAAETSEATVVRFCRSVGLTGYPELRIRLATESGRASAPAAGGPGDWMAGGGPGDWPAVGGPGGAGPADGDSAPGADLARIIAALASAALLGRGDLALGVSLSGATPDVIEVLRRARSGGAVTVALTNVARSPITEVAQVVLTTAAREARWRSGATASRIVQTMVLDCLFVGVALRDLTAAARALAATTEAVRPRRGSRLRR